MLWNLVNNRERNTVIHIIYTIMRFLYSGHICVCWVSNSFTLWYACSYDCVKNCGMSGSYWQETKFARIYNSCRKALKSNAQSARFTCPCVRIIWPLGIIRVQIKWTEEMRACQQFTPRIDMFSRERDRSRNVNTNMMYTSIVDIKLNLTAN